MGSSLTAVNMDLMSVRQRLATAGRPADARGRHPEVDGEAMRRSSRTCGRPCWRAWLREAVQFWATDYAGRIGIPLAIDIPEEPRAAGGPLDRAVQDRPEALANAERHWAKAIRLSMRLGRRCLAGMVDDGVDAAARGRRNPMACLVSASAPPRWGAPALLAPVRTGAAPRCG